jgi:hypothetical protein
MDTQQFNDYLEETSEQDLFNEYIDRNYDKNPSETSFTLMQDIAMVHLKFSNYTMTNYVYEHLSKKSLDKLRNVSERLCRISKYYN